MSQLVTLEAKDPDDTLDYSINWVKWLPSGVVITASEWDVPDGIVEEDPPVGYLPFTDTSTTVWLSGGTPGASYQLTNQITTSPGGRTRSKTITIRVKEL